MADSVYTNISSEDQVQANPSRITNAMWSNGNGILTSFYTESGVTSVPPINNAKYYYNIYGSDPNTSQVEFSIAYGHVSGAGAPSTDLSYPTKAIYSQYKNLLLNNPRGQFTYTSNGNTVVMDNFFAISINRANLKQKLDAGNWQLNLSGSTSLPVLHLIDNSNDYNDVNVGSNTRYYTVVSGTIGGSQVGTTAYGLVYPDYGIILLDANILSGSLTMPINVSTTTWTGSSGRTNLHQFYLSLNGASYFAARSEEIISSTHYFIRIKNQQYNYSTNPTFYSASDGTIIQPSFYNDPTVFITTVGLYDDDNELLAIAKLSEPIAKGFDKEALVRVRLDF